MNLLLIGVITLLLSYSVPDHDNDMNDLPTITLPAPDRTGKVSIEETLQQRRSVRDYEDVSLSLKEISQLAWSAQGITDEATGFRTAPSAGATFPMEVYLIITNTADVPDGVYRYNCRTHKLEKKIDGDLREELFNAALRQPSIINAPVVMIITGVLARTEQRYGQRALRYVYMEAGHVAQNVYLQGVALDVGTVVIGAFYDDRVSDVLQLEDGEYPLYIMPLGKMIK